MGDDQGEVIRHDMLVLNERLLAREGDGSQGDASEGVDRVGGVVEVVGEVVGVLVVPLGDHADVGVDDDLGGLVGEAALGLAGGGEADGDAAVDRAGDDGDGGFGGDGGGGEDGD